MWRVGSMANNLKRSLTVYIVNILKKIRNVEGKNEQKIT